MVGDPERTSTAPADELTALVGTTVDTKYRLEGVLGRGAMGVVFRARHVALDRPVALKVLRHLRARDGVLVRRFEREARTAAKLTHPHSVQVLDFGEDRTAGFLYLTMELVDGASLMDIMKRERRLDLPRAVRLMSQVASALEVAHGLEIIHRDIKPANIIAQRTPRGEEAKVCDFGLAKIVTEHVDPEATHDPKVKAAGTPVYMAPEQAIGDPLDPRADIYACGVVLYHLLVGKPPFLSRKSFEILTAHVSQPPPPPRAFVPEIPESMERLILWCLTKDREARCPSATELRAGLERIAREVGAPAPSTPASPPTPDLSSDLLLPTARVVVDPTPPPQPLPADAILDPPPVAPSPEEEADIEALVAQAVAEVTETKDRHRPHVQDSQMAGLDRGRHSDAVAERAAYMYTRYGVTYEPYRGDHPYWIVDPRGEALGPMGHDDLFRVIRRSSEAGAVARVLVSADEERWMPAEAFVRLLGLELLLDRGSDSPRDPEAGPAWSGDLRTTTWVAVFARVARERRTGRLEFRHGPLEAEERAEIHVVNGEPTFVYVNREGLQVPDLLVRQGLLKQPLLAGYLRRTLLEERPLEAILARDAGIDVGLWYLRFMQERLRVMASWTGGRFAFDATRMPSRLRAFSPSLLALSRDLVYRGMSTDALEAGLAPLTAAPPTPSELFADGVRSLRLAPAQAQMVRRMLRRRSLGEAIDAEGAHRKMALTLAYVMVESGILLAPLR